MQTPPNYTEQQVIEIVTKITNIVSHGFKFGYYDVEDIKQHAWVEALKALPKYDAARPLPNFLYSHILKRLINLKRDKYKRSDPPCKNCHKAITYGGDSPCGAKFCERYNAWRSRNQVKQNLINVLDITNINDEKENNTKLPDTTLASAERSEIWAQLDAEMPVELYSIYLRLRAGCSVPKAQREELIAAARRILGVELEDG